MAYSGMAFTRSRRVMPGCILPLKRTSTDSGMSSGITPVAAAKATRPEPGREGDADREAGVGVATGTDGIRQQQAVQPGVDHAVARTQGDTPPRLLMKAGSSRWVFTSTGFG